jgi:small multidrug resistance family-3 protein
MSPAWNLPLLLVAAVFEVGGDALIRRGLVSRTWLLIAAGFLILGTYGILVNLVRLDFSKLLGAYVGWFALVSIGFGRIVFGERVASSTWLGLALVVVGSLVIQFGNSAAAP